MTSASANNSNATIAQVKSLHIDDQLVLLALIYREIGSSVPAGSLQTSSEVTSIVQDLTNLSDQEQVEALRDLLPATKNDQDEVTLDPNPTRALGELIQGKAKVPTGKYGALNPESKLAVWYQLGQGLGSKIPSNFTPSAEVTQLFNSIKSSGNEQLVSFVTQLFKDLSTTHNEDQLHNEAGE